MTPSWPEWVRSRLEAIDDAGRRRTVRDFDALGPVGVVDGREVVSFASNDYLGLSVHPAVRRAAAEAATTSGVGAGASRLVVGARPAHRHLEEALATWKGADRALLLPTGYAANLGTLTSLADRDVVIYSDALNHASIVDGARLARADVAIYRHADLDHLATLLDAHPPGRRALVVSDTVFSMDGDAADVDGLLARCRAAGALLILDEAHAALGPELPTEAIGAPDVVRVGTLSKMLGTIGGFVAADADVVDLLVNTARPFIFTTAPSLPDTAAATAALEVLRGAEGDERRARLRALVDRFVPGHPSPVLPVLVGDERAAVAASAALLEAGYLVPAIRPPTVAPGTSRLRVALSALHTDAQVRGLRSALDSLGLVVHTGDGPP